MNKFKSIETVLTMVFTGVLLVSAVTVSRFLLQKNKEEEAKEELTLQIEQVAKPKKEGSDLTPAETSTEFTFAKEQFQYLKKINPALIGYLAFPDAFIAEPVVQGEDNEYYLSHWIDGSESSQGTVFADMHCNPSSTNITLYGHCVTYDDNAKFSPLRQLLDQNTYQQHNMLSIWYEDSVVTYKIINIAYYSVSDDFDFNFEQPDFGSEEEFRTYWSWFRSRNLISCEDTLSYGDRFLTLQTCDDWNADRHILYTCKEIQTQTY